MTRASLTAAGLLGGLALLTVAAVCALAAVAAAPAATQDAMLAQAGPSAAARADIPPTFLALYETAAARYRLDWAVLAAIGKVESDHGRSRAKGVRSGLNFAGCCAGPMQISLTGGARSTFVRFAVDADGDGTASPYSPADAIHTAARYLTASGAPGHYDRAIWAYNHSHDYVARIKQIAAGYRTAITPEPRADTGALLSSRNLTLSASQRADLASGRIDPRIVAILGLIASSRSAVVTSLRADHSTHTKSGSVSNHSQGRGVDLGAVDGERCTGTRSGHCGRLATELARITGPLHATELIYCFDPDGSTSSDAFARADHCDHIHIGYDS